MLNVQQYIGLSTLPQSYERVFEQASRQSVFLSLPWFQNFEQTIVSPDEKVLIYGVEEDGLSHLPLGVLVLQCKRQPKGWFVPRTIESLSNYYTSYFGPALACSHTQVQQISQAFASALWSNRPAWDVLNLRPQDPLSTSYLSMIASFKEVGMIVQPYFCFGNWYLDVAGRSYNDYFKSLPNVLRKNIPYMQRKLEKAYRVRTEMLTNEENLEAALDDYEKIYNASWRNLEASPQFIRGWVRTAMLQGWLRFGLLYIDDEPAAAQLWMVHAGVASIYKVCYDERFSKLSVGTILTARLMQHVIDTDHVREVDYLTGDDAYKENWMSHRRERWGIMAFNPYRIPGCLQAIQHVGGRMTKETFRQVSRIIKYAQR